MNKENPLVSIIITTYNRPLLLERCLGSIKNQNFNSENFEIIIVDDGSDLNNEQIVKKIFNEKFFVNYYKINHKGVAAARNYGIQKSVGDFIFFIDDDDEIDSKCLDNVYNFISLNGINIVDFSVIFIGLKQFLKLGAFLIKDKNITGFVDKSKYYNLAIGARTVISKKVFQKIGYFDEEMSGYEDMDFSIRCYQNKVEVFFLEKPLYFYYKNPPWLKENITTIDQGQTFINYLKFYNKNMIFFKKLGDSELSKYTFMLGRKADLSNFRKEALKNYLLAFKIKKSFKHLITYLFSFFYLGRFLAYLNYIIIFLRVVINNFKLSLKFKKI